LDEIDNMLLGVLEPNEILFCLDVMERSIRDIMSIVPWNVAYAYDSHFYYHELPTYSSSSLSNRQQPPPPRSISSSTATPNDRNDNDDDDEYSLFDHKYLQILEELRIDDE
jgi:hypothetical protein